MGSLFEEMSGTYILNSDSMYYLNLQLPKEEMPRYGKYGKYGRMRHTYLQEHKKAYYTTLLFDGKLVAHLNEIDDAANTQMELIIKKISHKRTSKYQRPRQTAIGHVQAVEDIASMTV